MSSLRQFLKANVNGVLGRFGCRIANTAPLKSDPTFPGMLLRLAARQPRFRTVVDVGASDGNWSRRLAAALPGPRNFLLVEAQGVHRERLERFQRDFPSTRLAHAAAGAEVGEIAFDASDPWGGVAASAPGGDAGKWIRVPMTTIDREVEASAFPGPYLIKLDTHGFEAPILAGAAATLAQTEFLVIESYNFPVSPTALRFPEFCGHMERLGFRCLDLFDVMYRPGDGALWQFDLVFARSDGPAFARKSYALGSGTV